MNYEFYELYPDSVIMTRFKLTRLRRSAEFIKTNQLERLSQAYSNEAENRTARTALERSKTWLDYFHCLISLNS